MIVQGCAAQWGRLEGCPTAEACTLIKLVSRFCRNLTAHGRFFCFFSSHRTGPWNYTQEMLGHLPLSQQNKEG
jgi:hypothetical protein